MLKWNKCGMICSTCRLVIRSSNTNMGGCKRKSNEECDAQYASRILRGQLKYDCSICVCKACWYNNEEKKSRYKQCYNDNKIAYKQPN